MDTDIFIDNFISLALTKKLQKFFEKEKQKGCSGFIFDHPVDIRPPFEVFRPEDFDKNISNADENRERPYATRKENIKTIRLWLHKNDNYKAERIDRFIRQLSGIDSPVFFEIVGNCRFISICLSTPVKNRETLKSLVLTTFPMAEIEDIEFNDIIPLKCLSESRLLFRDFCPEPPYYRQLTQFPHIQENSPLEAIFSVINSLDECEMGVYRVAVHPFPQNENWHRNIEKLAFCEQQVNQNNYLQLYSNQSDNDFNAFGKTNKIAEGKASPDLPFLAVRVSFAAFVKSESKSGISKGVDIFVGNYRYGGNALKIISDDDFIQVIGSEEALVDAVMNHQSFTQGMILNSLETVGFVNIPDSVFLREEFNVNVARGVKIPESLRKGKIYLGESNYGHMSSPVFIPADAQAKHIHIVGKIGYGKSTLLENLALEDIKNDMGICIIDPHGDLIDSILGKIPERRLDEVIYFNPTEKDFNPCFNPFSMNSKKKNISILSENLVYAFKKLFNHWGDRMERILRNTFFLLLSNTKLTLSDIPKLLSRTDDGRILRESAAQNVVNPIIQEFWLSEFESLGFQATEPIHNKISKLLTNENLNRIFSTPENRFDSEAIMNEGKILLVKIPTGILGIDSADVLGSMMMSLFHQVTIARADTPTNKRCPFNIYIDEFHRFTGREIEDFIVDGRKYKVGLILAHQQNSQLPESILRILGNCNVFIALHNDFQESRSIIREFPAQVEPEDLLKLGIGEAFVKVGSHFARVQLHPPATGNNDSILETIKGRSFSLFYRKNRTEIESKTIIEKKIERGNSRRLFCKSILNGGRNEQKSKYRHNPEAVGRGNNPAKNS